MAKIFFTSDLHFGHKNIIRYDNRPFLSVEEMDAEIVRRWNAKVSPDDIYYKRRKGYLLLETLFHTHLAIPELQLLVQCIQPFSAPPSIHAPQLGQRG